MERKKRAEGPYETVVRKLREAREEAEHLIDALGRSLQELPHDVPGTWTWLDLVLRWEQMETEVDVLRLCLSIQGERNPETVRNVSRQLRRWRRGEGKDSLGWIEVRSIRGYGPYIYYRWRDAGSRRLHTEYYGRGDKLLCDLALDAGLSSSRGQ